MNLDVAVSRSTATSTTPSGERCPTASQRGLAPLIDTDARALERPTTVTSVAAAGAASHNQEKISRSPAAAIESRSLTG